VHLLFHTQAFRLGGSLRLLLNLARHLAPRHAVTFAVPEDAEPAALALLAAEPRVGRVAHTEALAAPAAYDVLVGHFPFTVDAMAALPIPHRVAVSLEITARHRVPIDARQARRFDRILHLHPEQVAHLPADLRQALCIQLPIINDVDFHLPFRRTGAAGCIGANSKNDTARLVEILSHTPQLTHLILHEPKRRRLWSRKLTLRQRLLAVYFRRRGRLQWAGADTDLRRVFAGFDCLVHTPTVGNGTSMVVSDALACGKLVLLSGLPAYRAAYAGLPGVHFIEDTGPAIGPLLEGYDEPMSNTIRDSYRRIYDRDAVLARWEAAIVGAEAQSPAAGAHP